MKHTSLFPFFHLSFFFTAINLVKHSLVIFSILTSFQHITPLISMFLFLSLSLSSLSSQRVVLHSLCMSVFPAVSFFLPLSLIKSLIHFISAPFSFFILYISLFLSLFFVSFLILFLSFYIILFPRPVSFLSFLTLSFPFKYLFPLLLVLFESPCHHHCQLLFSVSFFLSMLISNVLFYL